MENETYGYLQDKVKNYLELTEFETVPWFVHTSQRKIERKYG